jgi:hypothetical protein
MLVYSASYNLFNNFALDFAKNIERHGILRNSEDSGKICPLFIMIVDENKL